MKEANYSPVKYLSSAHFHLFNVSQSRFSWIRLIVSHCAVTKERLSHTVCCLWLQQLQFISFCLLQHNCCQYSWGIFWENELQQKWFSTSLPSVLCDTLVIQLLGCYQLFGLIYFTNMSFFVRIPTVGAAATLPQNRPFTVWSGFQTLFSV